MEKENTYTILCKRRGPDVLLLNLTYNGTERRETLEEDENNYNENERKEANTYKGIREHRMLCVYKIRM